MTDDDWTGVIFGMGVLTLGTIILIVVLIVAERFSRARSRRDDMDQLAALVQKYEATTASAPAARSRWPPTWPTCAPA